MKDRKRKFKYILLSFLIISTTLFSLPGIATPRINMTEKLVLTFDDCIDRALNEDADKYQYQNRTLLKRELELNGMRRKYDGAVAMKGLAVALFNNFSAYNSKLEEKTNKISERNEKITELNSIPDDLEHSDERNKLQAEIDELYSVINNLQSELTGYDTMFKPLLGDTSISSVDKDTIFNLYIKVYSSAAYDLVSGIESFELSRDVVKNSISQGVRQLYDTLFGLYDNLALLEKSYDIKERQYWITNANYMNGQIAEVDKIKAKIELDQQKVNIDILKRNIENIKLRLKQQIGVWTEQEVEFKPIRTDGNIEEPVELDAYLNKAVDSRIEVISARSDVTSKDKMFEFTKEYVSDSSTDWIEAQIAVQEKNVALDDAKKSVEQDIKSGYNDVMEKREAIKLTKQKEESADVQYQLLKKQYEQGFLTESTLWSAELGYLSAKAAYQKALRDYDTALCKFENASDLGPSYNITKAGGK